MAQATKQISTRVVSREAGGKVSTDPHGSVAHRVQGADQKFFRNF
jgi:hypothetical protein